MINPFYFRKKPIGDYLVKNYFEKNKLVAHLNKTEMTRNVDEIVTYVFKNSGKS